MKPLDAKSPTLLHNAQQVLFVLFGIMVILAPLYFQRNFGGQSLNLPINATVWIASVFIISTGLLKMLMQKKIIIPRYLFLISVFPIGIIASGFISGIIQPAEWVLRIGSILGGVFIWFSIIQFRLTDNQTNKLLSILNFGIFILCLIGIIEYLPVGWYNIWLPLHGVDTIFGVFQQPNVNASMMATGCILSIYLITSKSLKDRCIVYKVIPFLSIIATSFSVLSSGSRAGLFGLIIGISVITIARIKYIKTKNIDLYLILFSLVIGFTSSFISNDGASFTIGKMDRLTTQGGDARPHIYKIAWDTFLESPWVGHGIGSFQSSFQLQRIKYYKTHPDYVLDNGVFTHPHNEILFWLDEGGIVSVASILIAALAVLIMIVKLRLEGLAIFSLLIPISLHSFVEYPFYQSSLHWLLFMIILAVIFSKDTKEKSIKMSKSAFSTCFFFTLTLPVITTLFLTHTLVSNAGLILFFKNKPHNIQYLNTAQNNFYFYKNAEASIWEIKIKLQFLKKDHSDVPDFIRWAKSYLETHPYKKTYISLAKAYLYQGDSDNALKTINLAASIYPQDEELLAQKMFINQQSKEKNPNVLAPIPDTIKDAARKAIDPSHVPHNPILK